MVTKFLLSLVLIAGLTAPAFAAGTDPTWEKFTSARRVYQMRLAEMSAQRWPENMDFFMAYRDLQLAYMERRTLVFYHLSQTQPTRIVRTKGGQAFMNFAWEKSEEAGFAKAVPGFARLSATIVGLEKKTKQFKHRDALKDKFARLEIDPEYLALMRETGRAIGDAEQDLVKSVPAHNKLL